MFYEDKTLESYDVLLVDVYGVIKGADGIIAGVESTLKKLVQSGKIVVILSNTTQKSGAAIASYERLGIKQNVHFHEVVTSGQVAYELITAGEIHFRSRPAPRKFMVLGTPRKELFVDSSYVESPITEADFFYISTPQLSEDEVARIPQNERKELFGSKLFAENRYDSLSIAPFLPQLKRMHELNLPALNANPDLIVLESDRLTNSARYVIRGGSIAQAYEQMGGEVLSIGKPHTLVFRYVLDLLASRHGIDIKSARMATIGDTLGTDILGALQASKEFHVSIDAILTLTGVSAASCNQAIINGGSRCDVEEELQRLFEREGITPDKVIASLGFQ